MVDVTQIDHEEAGLSLLPSTWDNASVIRGILSAWLTPLNTVEECAIGVRDGFNVSTAIGVQLDIIGAYFDESRQGRTDSEYRSAIQAIIASSNGSGTPDQLIDLFSALTSADTVGYWEHYPLSIAMVATGGDDVVLSDVTNMLIATPAAIEYAALMYDPNGYVWIGNEATSELSNVVDEDGNQVVDEDGNDVVAEVIVEDIDSGDYRSSFVDISVESPDSFGYGINYGVNYGGSPSGYSQLAETSISGNALVDNGGNGFVLWATESEYDPETGTTNKSEPIKQIQDTGLKNKQPLSRQFFNWMMANIDDWFSFRSDRNSIGTFKMTVDSSKTASDYDTLYGGTWESVGTESLTSNNITTYVFRRTA